MVESEEPNEPPTGLDLARLFATIAGIAIALGVFAADEGPKVGQVWLLPLVLLFCGLVLIMAVVSSMFAAWGEAGLGLRDLSLRRADDPPGDLRPDAYMALVIGTWGLWLTGLVGVILLATNAVE